MAFEPELPSADPTSSRRRFLIVLGVIVAVAAIVAILLVRQSSSDSVQGVPEETGRTQAVVMGSSDLARFVLAGLSDEPCDAERLAEALGTEFTFNDSSSVSSGWFYRGEGNEGNDQVGWFQYYPASEEFPRIAPGRVTAFMDLDTTAQRDTLVEVIPNASNLGAEAVPTVEGREDRPVLITERWTVGELEIQAAYERDPPQRLAWVEWTCPVP